MLFYRVLILILSLMGGRPTPAQQVSDEDGSLRALLISHEESEFKSSPLSVRADFESYPTSTKPIYGQGYSSNLNFTAARRNQGRAFGLKTKTDGALTYSAGEEWIHPKIKEASTGTEELRFGVVNEEWSSFEEEWRMGLFRPRFQDNKLSGGQGGLFGIHYRRSGFSVGVLPVFIPEFGPHFEEEDGRLVSKNPWFNTLPETLSYDGVEAPIRYEVNIPPLERIVAKPGIVMRYHTENGPLKSQASAAYKPMPQLLLNFPADGRFIIGNTDQYFSVEIQPWVAYHTVLSTDQSLNLPSLNAKARLSLAHEIPHVPNRPATWVTQEIGPATYVSSRLESNLDSFERATFFISQYKVFGGDEPDRGRYANEKSFFEPRQYYREAYGLGAETKWLKQRVLSSAHLIYDVVQKGGVVATSHQWKFNNELLFSATFEFLGLITDEPAAPSGFLSTYRANDRAEVGVTYVF